MNVVMQLHASVLHYSARQGCTDMCRLQQVEAAAARREARQAALLQRAQVRLLNTQCNTGQ
jgi:hypothetical protein